MLRNKACIGLLQSGRQNPCVENYELFASGLRTDAHNFARNLTANREEAVQIVDDALRALFNKCRDAEPGVTAAWSKYQLYRSILAATPAASMPLNAGWQAHTP